MFTQQHYEAIANIMAGARPNLRDDDGWDLDYDGPESSYRQGEWETWNIMLESLISVFRADNPRFKPDRFRTAALTRGQV